MSSNICSNFDVLVVDLRSKSVDLENNNNVRIGEKKTILPSIKTAV